MPPGFGVGLGLGAGGGGGGSEPGLPGGGFEPVSQILMLTICTASPGGTPQDPKTSCKGLKPLLRLILHPPGPVAETQATYCWLGPQGMPVYVSRVVLLDPHLTGVLKLKLNVRTEAGEVEGSEVLNAKHLSVLLGHKVDGRSGARAGATPQLPNLSRLKFALTSRGSSTQSLPAYCLILLVVRSMA